MTPIMFVGIGILVMVAATFMALWVMDGRRANWMAEDSELPARLRGRRPLHRTRR